MVIKMNRPSVYQVYTIKKDDMKCHGCNFHTNVLYVFAKSKKEAEKMYENGNGGICGECFSDMLTEDGIYILTNGDQDE